MDSPHWRGLHLRSPGGAHSKWILPRSPSSSCAERDFHGMRRSGNRRKARAPSDSAFSGRGSRAAVPRSPAAAGLRCLFILGSTSVRSRDPRDSDRRALTDRRFLERWEHGRHFQHEMQRLHSLGCCLGSAFCHGFHAAGWEQGLQEHLPALLQLRLLVKTHPTFRRFHDLLLTRS